MAEECAGLAAPAAAAAAEIEGLWLPLDRGEGDNVDVLLL